MVETATDIDDDEEFEDPAEGERVGRGRRAVPSFRDLLDRVPSGRGPVIGGSVAAFLLLILVAGRVDFVQVLVIGLQFGAVYALIGLGIVLVYKSTRVLNFAQGELGTVPTFVAYAIMVSFNWSDTGPQPDSSRLWWATLIAVLVGAGMAVLINIGIVQRLAEASAVTALVGTVGVTLLLTSVEVIVFDAKLRPFPRYVEGAAFRVGDTAVSWHTVIVVLILAGAATALAAFFRTPPGIALLATAQEPFGAELSGVSVRSMSLLAWGAAGALGAIGGLLGAGVFENVRPGLVTGQLLLPALTGAVLGGLTSMVGAVVGPLVLGVVVAFANELVLAYGWNIPGPPQIAIMIVLLGVLLVRPRGLFGKEA